MRNFKSFRLFSCVLAAFIILFTGIVSAPAATINVTASATDTLNGADSQCSLREAITNINNGTGTFGDCIATGAYGTSDTINIPAGTYTTTTSYNIAKNVSLVGAGAGTTTINGGGLTRVFYITGAYTVSISGITITGGNTDSGGGIYNGGGTLTVTDSTISGNTASFEGGGIYTTSGTLAVTNSTISGNNAVKAGGIFNWLCTVTVTNSTISGNTATQGDLPGGIYSYGWLTVTNSTITGNVGGTGGGINSYGWLTVTNSTISSNLAANAGGGIANKNGGGIGHSLTVINSTITGNSAPNGGGIYSEVTATLSNTIVAKQTVGADCAGAITSGGHNLESGTSCGFTGAGDLQNTNPLLGTLADNGGLTQTMALQPGSPAIDAGDNAICAAAPVNSIDQRSYSRPAGATCDIGAFELAASCVTPPRFGLDAWWRGENNAIDLAGTNNGTPINGVTYSTGHMGNAFNLNGTNQAIAVPDGIVPQTARNFTVGAWVNANSVAGSHFIFYGGANVGEYYLYMADGGYFSFGVNLVSSGGQGVTSPIPSSTGTWYYVAGVRRGTSDRDMGEWRTDGKHFHS